MLEENNNFNSNEFESTASQQNFSETSYNPYPFIPEAYYRKTQIRRLALAVGLPTLCLSAISYLWSFVYLFLTTDIAGLTYNQAIELSQNSAVQQILQIVLSCFMFLVPFTIAAKSIGVRIDQTIKFAMPKRGTFLPFVLFGIGFCSFANISMSYASSFFQSFGIDYDVDFGENPKGLFGFLLSFIATAIVPALVEEFACRGIVLGILRKQGESFAIITSSIVFGIMHGNLEQIPFAIMVGLILGYIYVKTESIWTCVIVHAANNAVSVIFSYFEDVMSTNMQNLLYVVYIIVSMLAAIIGVLIFAKSSDENYSLKKSEDNINNKLKYRWFFSSWAIILFILLNAIEAMTYFKI